MANSEQEGSLRGWLGEEKFSSARYYCCQTHMMTKHLFPSLGGLITLALNP